MKKIIISITALLALFSTGAFAQSSDSGGRGCSPKSRFRGYSLDDSRNGLGPFNDHTGFGTFLRRTGA